MNSPSASASKPDRDYRIFYIFMTLVIAAVYGSTVLSSAALREPWVFAGFTLLVLLHVTLHWLLERIAQKGWMLAYFIVQGMLAMVIAWWSGTFQMLMGLFMPLVGETIGLFGWTRKALLAIVYYLALSVVIFSIVIRPDWSGWVVGLVVLAATLFTMLYTTLYIRQVQSREKAQELLKELESANAKLSAYAAQVEDLTISNERQRMARELHDTLSQGLAGLILQLEAVDAHLGARNDERARTILQGALGQARATLADARRAIDDLRSNQSPGLEEMVRREAKKFTQSTGIPCDLEISLPQDLPGTVNETIRRLLLEGLNNVARHARAKQVTLSLVQPGHEPALQMVICDDGIGFDPSAVKSGHYGLQGMQERVHLVGGSLEVNTSPGQGTRLMICLPLEEKSGE